MNNQSEECFHEKYQKFWIAAFISSIIVSSNAVPTFAGDTSFQDISKSYWGYADIQWAIERKVTTGYPDGKFRPNQTIRQNELLAMLIRAFQPSDFQADSSSAWDVSYVTSFI
ncbi:S-layer homology domain-containing protein [Paenibacillus caui]|uniref:S-layer homology domain-containing protein n=1 Tax=Paenibacillus caui TaxID=2873927 RepID=UPI001CAA3E55|nr:S-layer homology domain-containing protein [Paenibacillus caui]